MSHPDNTTQALFDHLWQDYVSFNPGAKRIYDLLLERERKHDSSLHELANDHIALRTFNIAPINIKTLSPLIEALGYKASGEYHFTEKKLFAVHFEHQDESLPKIFISELKTEFFSPLVQKIAREVAASIDIASVKKTEFLWSRRQWQASHATYLELQKESEYAAWLYAFGFRANHFTISFNQLKTFRDLKELNEFIRASGYALNTSGGEIKGSPKVYLEQSSTMAEKTRVQFTDGQFEIPSCYYEFARRYPMSDGRLYQGFVETSADKIFESTNASA